MHYCKWQRHLVLLPTLVGLRSEFSHLSKLVTLISMFSQSTALLTLSHYVPSLLNKIIEKLVHKRLYFQFGFRKDHSTTLANTEIVENIREEISNGKFALGAYLDLSKALIQLAMLSYYIN